MAKLIVTLKESNSSVNLVGGKALNLAKLQQAGFPVPNAFVVITAAMNQMDQRLKDLILTSLKDLRTEKFAVRSSATVEDSAEASFAGQFESYLAVSREKIIEAIEKCWQSLKSERALVYCQHQKIDPGKIKMAVIIQEMIFAEKGGVIFTENIFQKKPDELIIEAAEGLGEKVVSGLVNPERVIVDKKSCFVTSRRSGSGSDDLRVLTDKEITQLVEIALKIEAFYEQPQDIEWAIMKNKIYILQSRPITK